MSLLDLLYIYIYVLASRVLQVSPPRAAPAPRWATPATPFSGYLTPSGPRERVEREASGAWKRLWKRPSAAAERPKAFRLAAGRPKRAQKKMSKVHDHHSRCAEGSVQPWDSDETPQDTARRC